LLSARRSRGAAQHHTHIHRQIYIGDWASQPNMTCEWPPGGAWIRVEDRSVMTFPAFWFEPVAKRLDDVPRFVAALVEPVTLGMFVLEVWVKGLLLELS